MPNINKNTKDYGIGTDSVSFQKLNASDFIVLTTISPGPPMMSGTVMLMDKFFNVITTSGVSMLRGACLDYNFIRAVIAPNQVNLYKVGDLDLYRNCAVQGAPMPQLFRIAVSKSRMFVAESGNVTVYALRKMYPFYQFDGVIGNGQPVIQSPPPSIAITADYLFIGASNTIYKHDQFTGKLAASTIIKNKLGQPTQLAKVVDLTSDGNFLYVLFYVAPMPIDRFFISILYADTLEVYDILEIVPGVSAGTMPRCITCYDEGGAVYLVVGYVGTVTNKSYVMVVNVNGTTVMGGKEIAGMGSGESVWSVSTILPHYDSLQWEERPVEITHHLSLQPSQTAFQPAGERIVYLPQKSQFRLKTALEFVIEYISSVVGKLGFKTTGTIKRSTVANVVGMLGFRTAGIAKASAGGSFAGKIGLRAISKLFYALKSVGKVYFRTATKIILPHAFKVRLSILLKSSAIIQKIRGVEARAGVAFLMAEDDTDGIARVDFLED